MKVNKKRFLLIATMVIIMAMVLSAFVFAQGDEEPVDVVDMRLDKAVRLIRGPKGTTVNLTIQKIDGVQKVISIIRDVVIIEATYAKSIIITDEETNKDKRQS